MENEFDEIFTISSKNGEMVVDVENSGKEEKSLSADTVFEQSPEQMVDALMPLFLGSQILRALQESYASELASRMVAMKAASDNAKELIKDLNQQMNRARQALVT
tara:strand:- start:149 stop:463 length:315 start_codon:yes stop_codon:yes gene_type:complete